MRSIKMVKSHHLIVLVAIFFISFGNIRFFLNLLEVYPLGFKNIGFLLSIAWGFTGVIILLLLLVCFKYTIKPILIIILLLSSFASYFMDSYNTVIDDSMINNILSTDVAESLDLLSLKLGWYVVFLGILPSYFVYKTKLLFRSIWQETISRLKLFGFILLSILAVVFVYSDFYSSFFREHKPLRYYSNPSYYVFSTGKYIAGLFQEKAMAFETIGLDVHIPAWGSRDRELIIFVVGETARADRFSLNGYKRETNPLLKKEAVVSFTDFWSCGTSTAVSVPCMFSKYNRPQYEKSKAKATENVLDVLKRAGVNILWLDNNSDSKGVANRVTYQSYKHSEINPVCDTECRDEGMLKNLQQYIDEHKQGDILIVLHQMGQHGPAYYKRYPSTFEKFIPVCKTNQLEDCSREELGNAYDNAILYTDYFLSQVISFLKKNDADFEAAMFYVSDHGESLGENGLYLHGLPYLFAPDTQKHVPAIIWLGKNFYDMDIKSLVKKQNRKYTHDNIFHTLLGFMEIESSVYDQTMDILHN